MGQDVREGEKEQGGDVPVPGGAAGAEGGLAREATSSEQENVTGAGNAGGRGAAGSESEDEDDTEEALTEDSDVVVAPVGNAGQGGASGSAQDEDHEAPAPEENPATMAHFELRGFRPARRAIAHATPPSSYRLPLRGRKRWNPSRLPIDDAGDAASGCGNAYHDPATSEAASGPAASAASPGSPSATSRPAGAPAMANAGVHGGNNQALGSTATRSVKASDPERDVSPILHLTRTRPPEMDAAVGKSSSPGGCKSGADAKHAAAASCRLPSRSRKRRRPEHFPDTEEAVAAARARARRSDASLDRFLTCVACASAQEQQRPPWATGTASGGGPEETNESARVLAIAAVLGAALALSVVSCVLFYIVGQQTASGPGPSDSRKKK